MQKLQVVHGFCCFDIAPVLLANVTCKWIGGFNGNHRIRTRFNAYQDLSAQLAELKAVGAVRVFKEKQSGARGDRAELAKAIRALDHGDVLVVTRLDRLARSTRDLLNTIDAIAKRGAGFRSCQCHRTPPDHLSIVHSPVDIDVADRGRVEQSWT